jgi:predicted dehydrogenase
MKKKLRVGVIGLGMGRWHVRGYQSHPAAAVVAVADADAARLQEMGDELGVPGRYTDPLAMLAAEDLDVVSVATPNRFHAPLSIAALRAGCHVLCEKPMAMNAREARAMCAAAARARRRLMINFSYRFSPASQQLKAQVDRGAVGEVYFARTFWHRRRGMPKFGGWFGQRALSGGGPLIDLGVHRLDLALWLMGYPEPAWVMGGAYDHIASRLAKEQGKSFDVEDLAGAFIRFRNGASLVLEASWAGNIADPEWMETRLWGRKGGLVQRNVGGGYQFEAELYVERKGDVVARPLPPPPKQARSGYWRFIDAIAKGVPHPAGAREGLIVMQILEAIYRSAATGRPVRVG